MKINGEFTTSSSKESAVIQVSYFLDFKGIFWKTSYCCPKARTFYFYKMI